MNFKRYWVESVLALFGIAALTALWTVCLRPGPVCEPPLDPPPGLGSSEISNGPSSEELHKIVRIAGPDAIPILLDWVALRKASPGKTAEALRTLGPAAVPALLAHFEHENDQVRTVAVRTVGLLGACLEPEAATVMPALAKRLGDSSARVRYAAILALNDFGPSREQAVPQLIAALECHQGFSDDETLVIQETAAYTLGKMGPSAKAAIVRLETMLEDRRSPIRTVVAVALWRISHDTNCVLPRLARMEAETNTPGPVQAAAARQWIGRDMQQWFAAASREQSAGGEGKRASALDPP